MEKQEDKTQEESQGKNNETKKLTKEQKKQERLAARQKQQQQEEEYKKDPNDPCFDKFGDLDVNKSQSDPQKRYEIKYTPVKDLTDQQKDQVVHIIGRLHQSRVKGKAGFLIIREQFSTVQTKMFVGESISKGMIEFAKRIPNESIVSVKGVVEEAKQEITGCTQKVEISIEELWTINRSASMLPFQIEDASRKVENQDQEDDKIKQEEGKGEEEKKQAVVKQDVRLNNRIIDLRVPANQALMRISSGVCLLFREFLLKNDFIEIHTPKLIGGTSEGGANVFRLKYFEQDACLAQSPQLYKQMMLCADFQRVFEIGPVFRAEDSNTNRHLCEFTGLDVEMVFKHHYFEVLDILADMLVYIFDGLHSRFQKELQTINEQYPFEPFKCKVPVVRLDFKEGVQLLKEHGYKQEALEDLDSINEKALGKIVRDKYDTDFYMLYGYPTNARPFYTMLDPVDPNYSNSYDFFMRGEEITSGAQRIHIPELLAERATAHKIPLNTIQDYIDSFKYGIQPHGGCGIGLERVVKFFCDIKNIRKCSHFARDPKRLKP